MGCPKKHEKVIFKSGSGQHLFDDDKDYGVHFLYTLVCVCVRVCVNK